MEKKESKLKKLPNKKQIMKIIRKEDKEVYDREKHTGFGDPIWNLEDLGENNE